MYRTLTVLLIGIMSLAMSGCSSIPMQKTADYFENLYKRIGYKKEGNYRVIDVFYSTSREVVAKEDGTLKFKPKMGTGLTDGMLNVKIDPRIKIGKMLPQRFKHKGEIGIQEIQKLDNSEFMKKLSDAVNNSPHKSLLVLVFGFKDDFESVAIEAAYFAYMLDVNTPVLLFDWPGDQMVSIHGYHKAQKYAIESGPYLGELLGSVIRDVKPEKIWIHSSSMGCQVVCDAFENMYENSEFADPEAEIAHVFLAAPDVGEAEFDKRFKDQLAALSKGLTTYVASNDDALLMSGILNREKRLGRQNIKENLEQAEEAKDMLYLKSMEPDRIALVDVTPINKASYGHGYYLEDPAYFDDVYLRIFSDNSPKSRGLYLMKYKGDTDYWVLKN
ncbi:MAG: alpha/beta hydrolase [Candidatus Omnitrophica bacterium]|nr:alpha/beta hydrolase [Candidatus Omnitrophota bacterium]